LHVEGNGRLAAGEVSVQLEAVAVELRPLDGHCRVDLSSAGIVDGALSVVLENRVRHIVLRLTICAKFNFRT
jgi:hypothetical protein